MTRGNSELTLATASADTDGKWDQNELLFSANGAYGRSKGQGQAETTSTADLARGVAQYNRLFGDRCYTFGRVEGRHDGIANLAYRVSLGAGAGYFFIKNTNTDLSAEVGPGYVFQKQGNDATSYTSVRFGERFNQALSDRARLWQSLEYSPQVDDFNNFVANGVIGLEADLTRDKKLALRSFVTDSFNNQPVPGFNRNDLTWVTAIAYKF
jgi:putative salt-induced outer membrane protein YdiY